MRPQIVELFLTPEKKAFIFESMNRKLTKMEKKVFFYTIIGYKNEKISEKLKIRIKTVKFHLGNVFKKLKVDSRHSLIWCLDLKTLFSVVIPFEENSVPTSG